MKAVLGAAVAALLVGLGVGWVGHVVLYDDAIEGTDRVAILLGAGAGPGTEAHDAYVVRLHPGSTEIIAEYRGTAPPETPFPVVYVDARIACHVRLGRPTMNQWAQDRLGLQIDVAAVERPVVVSFDLHWVDEPGPELVYRGRELDHTVLYGPDGATVRPDWCD